MKQTCGVLYGSRKQYKCGRLKWHSGRHALRMTVGELKQQLKIRKR